MLIILLAQHSNSDYEECLNYVGTEGNAKLSVYSVNAEQRHLISVGRAKVRNITAPQRTPYDGGLIQASVYCLLVEERYGRTPPFPCVASSTPTARSMSLTPSPCLMANVAVSNFRFLDRLGLTECQWFEGIGNSVTMRKIAIFGVDPAVINPDLPTVLTLKILFSQPGLPIEDQTVRGRTELLTTPFRTYEARIRNQFRAMYGKSGFDADRDIAGIILNRWGHAYLSPQPGFFFGTGGRPRPGEVLRWNPHGRIAFANSDLSGIMDHRMSILEATPRSRPDQ